MAKHLLDGYVHTFEAIEVAVRERGHLISLGTLAAGLAHELNNPAAAAQRAAQNLLKAMENIRTVSLRLLRHESTEAQRRAIFEFELKAGQRAGQTGSASDPLELSDREERVTQWLSEHNVAEPWAIASQLAEGGVDQAELNQLASVIGKDFLGDALHRVAGLITVFGLVREIENSSRRISDLVAALNAAASQQRRP
jgi:signal transduction histidine kinase